MEFEFATVLVETEPVLFIFVLKHLDLQLESGYFLLPFDKCFVELITFALQLLNGNLVHLHGFIEFVLVLLEGSILFLELCVEQLLLQVEFVLNRVEEGLLLFVLVSQVVDAVHVLLVLPLEHLELLLKFIVVIAGF